MLERYGRLVYRFQWWFLAAGLLFIIGAGVYGSGVYGSLNQGGFDVPGSQSSRADSIIDRQFGGNHSSLVVLTSSPHETVDDPAYRQALEQLQTVLRQTPGTTGLESYLTSGDARFVSHDRHQSYLLVGLQGDDTAQTATVERLRPLVRRVPLRVQLGGAAAVNAESTAYVRQDLARAERYAFPFTALLLVIIFGSLAAAALPLAVGLYGIFGALVITRLVAYATPMSVYVLNLISLLGLGLAIDYSLFVVSRFREELHKNGGDVAAALARSLGTAGRTIIFSALTVLIALAGLIIFPMGFLRSMGIGGAAAVLVALAGALLFLPALLAILGPKVDALSVASLLPRRFRKPTRGPGNWARLSRWVMRWPRLTVLTALAVLLLAGVPFLGIHFTNPDYHVLPAGSQARAVGVALQQHFAATDQTPIQLVIPGRPASEQLQTYRRQLTGLPNVAAVAEPVSSSSYTLINVYATTDTYSVPTKNLVAHIQQLPADGFKVLVGGQTADLTDLLALIRHDGVYALIVILGGMLALFFLMLGSLVIPLKTIILNVLSLSAAFGALVWIFQQGHLASWLGIMPEDGIDATQPVIIFALAFGLSMDYAVFLFSRVKEHFDEQADIRQAIAWGVQRTGGIITSAALLLLVVIASFTLGRIIIMKEVGIGLIVAVLVDVFIVRLLLVPASMTLLGRHNWWAPNFLKKLYGRFGIKETD
jgi:RND superfamily putative drug exporter